MDPTLFDPPDPLLDAFPVDEVDTTELDAVTLLELDPDRLMPAEVPDALAEIDSLRALRASAEAREFALAGHVASIAPRPAQTTVTGAEQVVDLGGDGCPAVPEFIALELAALLRISHTSARALIADSLSVRHRHPRLWRAVMDGVLPVWQARRVARAVRWAGLDLAGALRVDRCIAPAVGKVSWPRLEALVEGEIVAADPQRAAEAEERARKGTFVRVERDEQGTAGVRSVNARVRTSDALNLESTIAKLAAALGRSGDEDSLDMRRAKALGILATPGRAMDLLTGGSGRAEALLPAVRLYLHVNASRLDPDDVARLEGEGALPLGALRALLADSKVRVTAVIDHRESEPIDAYEIPERLREKMALAQPYEVFPWGTRRVRHADLDHNEAYRHAGAAQGGAPAGQTRPDNLGPIGRTAHRAKTHAGWRCRQVRPGSWLWRTPYGATYVVDNQGASRWTFPDLATSAVEAVARRSVRPEPRSRRRPTRPGARRRSSGPRPAGRRSSRRSAPASLRRSS